MINWNNKTDQYTSHIQGTGLSHFHPQHLYPLDFQRWTNNWRNKNIIGICTYVYNLFANVYFHYILRYFIYKNFQLLLALTFCV